MGSSSDAAFLLLAIACVAGCGGTPTSPASMPDGEPVVGDVGTTTGELYPDVLAAKARRNADGTWRFEVTLSSPYDSPARHADAWRILAPDGTELGIRILTHDHASEQPFTRSLDRVVIAPTVTRVTIEGRDQVSGWGGETVEVQVGGR